MFSLKLKKILFLLILALVFVSCGFIGLGGRGRGVGKSIYHTVRSGESLYTISQKYGTDYESIAIQNGIHDPNRIYVGQKLLVRYGSNNISNGIGGSIFSSNKTSNRRASSRLKISSNLTRSIGKLYKPVSKAKITSRFGPRRYSFHDGIDFSAPSGTPVYAAHGGTVAYAGNALSGYGNLIVIRSSSGFSTVYAHNRRLLVSSGQRIEKGQKIAEVGSTGRSTGPHLHFELRIKDQNGRFLAIDPSPFL